MEKIKCVERMVHMTSFGCRHLGVPTVPPHSSWCCQCPPRDQAQLPDALLPPLPGICTAAPACTCPRALLPVLHHFSAALPSPQTPHQHTCIVNHSIASPKPFAAVLCWVTTQRSHAVSQCCKDNTSGTAKPKPTALLGPKDDTTAAANSEQFPPKTNWHPPVQAFLLFLPYSNSNAACRRDTFCTHSSGSSYTFRKH